MAKKKDKLDFVIDTAEALAIVSALTKQERRDKRFELGRLTRLQDLSREQASFFFGECVVFAMVSPDINEWINVNFVEKGGTVKNFARMKELYEFYLALTSDVDIRYDLEQLDDGGYDVKEPSIVGNDYYIPRR